MKKEGTPMSSQPFHAIAGRTLRHWTIERRQSVGDLQWPAPPPPYSEHPDGDPLRRLASKLARVKSDIAHCAD
jgi:hypothetical protein